MSPEFGSIPSPPGSPLHASLPLGSPLDSPLRLPLRARNLSAPSGEIDDFGSGVGGESTPKPRRESPSRRLSFTSDVEWLGNGSPSSSPSKSSNRVVVVSPPPLLELEGVPAQPAISLPPVVPPSAPIASPPTAVPAPSAPPPPRSDNSNNAEFPSGSLRKRRVPAPLLNIPPPPSAFPTPPPVPVSGDIPPPLPSSFSRGYRSRIVRGAVPWRDGKID
ncbi:uncharacterized protein COLE_06874 [Cutaneotrichosporon oleaginosum]|nr:hypothetical protein COLE_06874 [Cutaneotrichosporon oleaginosum]